MISEAQQLTVTVRFTKYPSDFTSHLRSDTAASDAVKGLKKERSFRASTFWHI